MRQMRLNAGGDNVLKNFGNEVDVWKLLRSSVDRGGFEKRLDKSLFSLNDDRKIQQKSTFWN